MELKLNFIILYFIEALLIYYKDSRITFKYFLQLFI